MDDVLRVLDKVLPIVGVAVGAGLTYWLGALNRRHQEAREDQTRWYEARLNAYVELSRAAQEAQFGAEKGNLTNTERKKLLARFLDACALIDLVGSWTLLR